MRRVSRDFGKVVTGAEELRHLGFQVADSTPLSPEGYFAGSESGRRNELLSELDRDDVNALVAVRGGYGSNYLLDNLEVRRPEAPKIILGYSDLTSLQAYLWKRYAWVGFYGPMLAAGLDGGAGAPKGYDKESLRAALGKTDGGWTLKLRSQALVGGEAVGQIVGGCVTLIETSLGTPWELDTRGAILLLEDRGVKPYQLDRMLLHLKQAGKFEGVRGIGARRISGVRSSGVGATVSVDVCARIWVRWGFPWCLARRWDIRRARCSRCHWVCVRDYGRGEGRLEILEPAVRA